MIAHMQCYIITKFQVYSLHYRWDTLTTLPCTIFEISLVIHGWTIKNCTCSIFKIYFLFLGWLKLFYEKIVLKILHKTIYFVECISYSPVFWMKHKCTIKIHAKWKTCSFSAFHRQHLNRITTYNFMRVSNKYHNAFHLSHEDRQMPKIF